jgi:hypothetical protein
MKDVQGIQTFKRGVWRFLTCKEVQVDVSIRFSLPKKKKHNRHIPKGMAQYKLLNTTRQPKEIQLNIHITKEINIQKTAA